MFGGVLGGLAIYLNFNVNIMRLLIVILALCTQVWPCIVMYLIVWMVIPAAKSPRQRLEMYGAPVTVSTVGQAVLSSRTTPPPYNPSYNSANSGTNSGTADFFNLILTIFAKIVIGIIGLCGFAIAATALCFLVIVIVGWVMMAVSGDITILNGLDLEPQLLPTLKVWGVITACLTALIPAIAVIWAACTFIFKVRGASAAWWITALILEIIFITATGVIWNYINSYECIAAITIPATSIASSALC